MITRKEAIEDIDNELHTCVYEAIVIVNDIYDSYEESVCLNCTHFKDTECTVIQDWNCYDDCPANWTPPVGFGCNLFIGEPDD